MCIEDFSASPLQYMFINHISREAKIITDKWTILESLKKVINLITFFMC